MIDFGIDKLAIIGAVALIVIGPERLPRVARTVGALVGKAQRYVSQVQSEVNRSIELEELRKVQSSVQNAASDLQQSVQSGLSDADAALSGTDTESHTSDSTYTPSYSHLYAPRRKSFRLKRGATPLWYKQKNGVKRHVQSGAARVARFRPPAGR